MKIDAIALVEILQQQSGPANGLRVYDLAMLLTGDRGEETLWRKIRSTIKALRMQGVPICGHPSRGYYWAESSADIEATIKFLRDRAMSSLVQISRLRRVAIPVLDGQLSLVLGAAPIEPITVLHGMPGSSVLHFSA